MPLGIANSGLMLLAVGSQDCAQLLRAKVLTFGRGDGTGEFQVTDLVIIWVL